MDFEKVADRELEEWLGVTWAREIGRKHVRLVLTFEGRSRFVIYPGSPSDSARGQRNHVRDIRQALTELGASRTPRLKATVERCRNKPVRNPLDHIPHAPVIPDPWAALRSGEME